MRIRWFLVGIVSLLVSWLLVGCGVPQEQHDAAVSDLNKAQQELQSVKPELAAMQAKVSEMTSKLEKGKTELEATQAQYDDLSVKYDALSATYDDLSAKYDKLSKEYDAMIQGAARIGEEDLEQLIFELINRERQNNGLNKLEWYGGLYKMAKDHSQHMATTKRLEYSEHSVWQDIFLAVGYSTGDRIANAALTTWKQSLQYEANFLNEHAKYGAVGVYKAGTIFYITYFAHVYG